MLCSRWARVTSCLISPRSLTTPKTTGWSFNWREIPAVRIFRSFTNSLDGQNTWSEFVQHVQDDEKSDYFRLTLPLERPGPALDDYRAIDALSSKVKSQPEGHDARHSVLMALLTASLFLELLEHPKFYSNKGWYCNAVIKCRSSGALRSLLRLHPSGDLEFFNGGASLTEFVRARDICSGCQRYRKPVHFYLNSLDSEIDICVKWGTEHSRKISAMPQRMSWFVDMQELDAPFNVPSQIVPQGCGKCMPQTPKLPASSWEPSRFHRIIGDEPQPQRHRPERAEAAERPRKRKLLIQTMDEPPRKRPFRKPSPRGLGNE